MNGHAASNIPQPSSKIDWANIKFDLAPTNGFIKYTWKNGSWNSGELVKDSHVNLSIASVALNYGQSCFEGLKAYRHKDGSVRIFRPQENAARMNHSAAMVQMPELPEEIFLDAVRRCVAANLEFVPPYGEHGSTGALYLRPLYFGSGANLILASPDEFTFAVWCTPVGSLYGAPGSDAPGVDALVLNNFDRTAPMGTGSGKLAGNYAPVFGPTVAAKKAGYGITLHLDSATRTMVDEFSTSNCLMLQYENGPSTAEGDRLKKPTLYVPKSNSILKSVTTKSLAQLAEKTLGWNVTVAPVPFADVKAGKFDEMAAAGTAAIVTPVRTVTYHTSETETAKVEIGNGKTAGPAFLKLMSTLTGIHSGDINDDFGWLWPKEGVQPM